MSRVGDIVLKHQQDFQQVYVPYITNLMYQEAVITELLFVPFSYFFQIEHIIQFNIIDLAWQCSNYHFSFPTRQGNRKFALILKKLEKDPQCQRQTLKSFLILPFQRITRMTLLLEVGFPLYSPRRCVDSSEKILLTSLFCEHEWFVLFGLEHPQES